MLRGTCETTEVNGCQSLLTGPKLNLFQGGGE